ncbi:MAG TPA: hypothetical protein VND22_02755 [Actinomycetota bacterium]|nr:hypothetical protein [Actinomycetota bacterium]
MLIPLGIPIFFGLVGLMAAAWKLRVTLGLVALLFQLFWLITGFSIGLFYIPAAMAMIVAAVLNAIPDSGRTASASEASLTGAEDLDDFVKRPEPPVE